MGEALRVARSNVAALSSLGVDWLQSGELRDVEDDRFCYRHDLYKSVTRMRQPPPHLFMCGGYCICMGLASQTTQQSKASRSGLRTVSPP